MFMFFCYINIWSYNCTIYNILIRDLDTTLYSTLKDINNVAIIGKYYAYFGIVFGIIGIVASIIMRIELYSCNTMLIANPEVYNYLITLHGLILIFWSLMPILFGAFGNILIPILNGTNEVIYPRLNLLSLILVLISYILFMTGFGNVGFGLGWTMYPPHATSYTVSYMINSFDLVLVSLVMSGVSTLLSTINFLATIFVYRTSGYNLFNWAFIVVCIMLVVTLPILSSGLIMFLLDIHWNTSYFNMMGGDPVLYEHLFWFFGHPEVYVLILPAFGMVSSILGNTRQLFGYNSMILAMLSIGILGSVVWGHHLYTVGLEADTRAYFTAVTILISIPTGTKIFNWLCVLFGSYFVTWTGAYTLLFVLLFTLGGITGVIMGNGAVDIALHDTYYIVAHFHFTLSLGALVGIILGLIHYYSMLFGYELSPHIVTILLLLLITYMMTTFIPLHQLVPRRISYHSNIGHNMYASISALCSFVVFITGLILFNYTYNDNKLLYDITNSSIAVTTNTLFPYNIMSSSFTISIRESMYVNSFVSILVLCVIVSEALLFAGFFWGLLHSCSNTISGIIIPHVLLIVITVILSNIAIANATNMINSIVLALLFLSTQVVEFVTLGFSVNDGSYGNSFFVCTSLHFSHVVVGVILLLLNLDSFTTSYNAWKADSRHHLSWFYVVIPTRYYHSLLYWHLVELLWIVITCLIYL